MTPGSGTRATRSRRTDPRKKKGISIDLRDVCFLLILAKLLAQTMLGLLLTAPTYVYSVDSGGYTAVVGLVSKLVAPCPQRCQSRWYQERGSQ